VFLHLCGNRPFLVALSASVLTISLSIVYTKREIFANRFLSKNGGDLREVLRYYRCIFLLLRGVLNVLLMINSTVAGDLRMRRSFDPFDV